MQDMAERRSERRRSVFLRAKIFGAGVGGDFECSIQDASRSGCKIISNEIGRIPEEICLTILGETFQGRIVWRKADMAGVEFTGAAPNMPAA